MTLIKQEDAIEAVLTYFIPRSHTGERGEHEEDFVRTIFKALPSADSETANLKEKFESADAVDCTDFIEWLVDRVLDETIWEYNSVAYGEIICRKLEKLGVLEVTEEPSYYIRPSADAVQGEWVYDHHNDEHTCSICGRKAPCDDYVGGDWQLEVLSYYCPSCGARMKGGDSE